MIQLETWLDISKLYFKINLKKPQVKLTSQIVLNKMIGWLLEKINKCAYLSQLVTVYSNEETELSIFKKASSIFKFI